MCDHHLRLMIRNEIDPKESADEARALRLITECKIPLVRQHLARRIASN